MSGQRGGAIRSGGPDWRGWEEIDLESRKTGLEPVALRHPRPPSERMIERRVLSPFAGSSPVAFSKAEKQGCANSRAPH